MLIISRFRVTGLQFLIIPGLEIVQGTDPLCKTNTSLVSLFLVHSFIQSVSHLFNEYLLSVHYMLGTAGS